MAIPNISDYFRSQQQFGRSLDEQRRQFDAAKEQRDQQFYTNMFVSPLMQMGTGSLGKFIGEQMPLEQEKLKGMQIENEVAGLRRDRLGMGRAAEDAMGHIFTGSPEAANPPVVAPVKPATPPAPGRQGMFTPSGIEPTPSPNTNLLAGLPTLSDMYGSGGSHAGVPFSAGGDGGPNVDPGATDGKQSVATPLPGEGPPTSWEDTANRYWSDNPFATRPDPEARAMDSVDKEKAEQNPASRAQGAVPLLRSDTKYDWNYLQPLMARGATGIGAPFGGTASPQAAKVKQAVDRVIAQRAAAKVPPGDAMNPSSREIAWKDTPPMRAQSVAPRGPAMQLPGLQSTAAPQMSMGRPAVSTPSGAPPSTGVPFGRGVEDAGLGERGPIEQGMKDIGSMRVEPTSAFVTRPTDFDPAKARAMIPQEAAAALLEKYGKYGFTPDHLDRLVKQADAQQDLALGQQNAAKAEWKFKALKLGSGMAKDSGTQKYSIGHGVSIDVPNRELDQKYIDTLKPGEMPDPAKLTKPVNAEAWLKSYRVTGGGGGNKGEYTLPSTGALIKGPAVDSSFAEALANGRFKAQGMTVDKVPRTRAQKADLMAILLGREAGPGVGQSKSRVESADRNEATVGAQEWQIKRDRERSAADFEKLERHGAQQRQLAQEEGDRKEATAWRKPLEKEADAMVKIIATPPPAAKKNVLGRADKNAEAAHKARVDAANKRLAEIRKILSRSTPPEE